MRVLLGDVNLRNYNLFFPRLRGKNFLVAINDIKNISKDDISLLKEDDVNYVVFTSERIEFQKLAKFGLGELPFDHVITTLDYSSLFPSNKTGFDRLKHKMYKNLGIKLLKNTDKQDRQGILWVRNPEEYIEPLTNINSKPVGMFDLINEFGLYNDGNEYSTNNRILIRFPYDQQTILEKLIKQLEHVGHDNIDPTFGLDVLKDKEYGLFIDLVPLFYQEGIERTIEDLERSGYEHKPRIVRLNNRSSVVSDISSVISEFRNLEY